MATDRRKRRSGPEDASSDVSDEAGTQGQRVDRWLFFARISKSRTLAQKLCQGGHVRVNRDKARTGARTVRPGDVLTLSLPSRVRVLRIVALGARRGPAIEARALYDEIGPDAASAGNPGPSPK